MEHLGWRIVVDHGTNMDYRLVTRMFLLEQWWFNGILCWQMKLNQQKLGYSWDILSGDLT